MAKKKNNTTLIIVIAIVGMLLVNVLPVLLIIGLYVLVGGGVAGYMVFLAKGELHMVCPEAHSCGISIDGGEPERVDGGSRFTTKLDKGEHVIRVADLVAGTEVAHRVDVGAGVPKMLVPASPDQCFVRLDVTEAMYGGAYRNDVGPPLPTVADRYGSSDPIDIPSSTYVTQVDLPTSLEQGYAAYLVEDVPCSMIEKSDGDILEYLGF
jgi:hypothetical protein